MDELTDLLQRSWTHSHEEDGPDTLVFRPRGWHFPPARGRRTLEFGPDGAATTAGPGANDQPSVGKGRWRMLPGNIIELEQAGRKTQLRIFEASPDKLVIARD